MWDVRLPGRMRWLRRAVGSAACAAALLATSADRARALEIVFDYSYDASGFFDDPARRSVLEAAADAYEGCIDDDGFARLPPDGWIALFRDPSADAFVSVLGLEVPADAIRIFVGAKPSFADGRLASGGPGHLRFPCTALLGRKACMDAFFGGPALPWIRSWLLEHAFRGSAAARAYPADDFAIWGGVLSFASDADWHFDPQLPVPPDRFDLLTSAIHELGHVLGIGTAESWGVRVPRRSFEGTEAVEIYGEAMSLAPDRAHFADGTSSHVRGVPQRAVFTNGQARGERRLLTELDCAALRDLGWRRGVGDPASSAIENAYAERRIKGDVNGDGVVDADDAAHVRAALDGTEPPVDDSLTGIDALLGGAGNKPVGPVTPASGALLEDAHAFEAADVFPMLDGDAVGDGVVDARDLALLEDVADDDGLDDADGDGIPTVDENAINWLVWLPLVGRPRHAPLTSWTDACLEPGVFGPLGFGFLVDETGLSLESCSRRGSPWSRELELSPEEALEESAPDEAEAPPQSQRESAPLASSSAEAADVAPTPAPVATPRPRGSGLPFTRVPAPDREQPPDPGVDVLPTSAAPALPAPRRPVHALLPAAVAQVRPESSQAESAEPPPGGVEVVPMHPAADASNAAAPLADWIGAILVALWHALERLVAWLGSA